MTSAARAKPADSPSPLEVFTARAWARATLWQAGELDLHEAVDVLQAAAERDGLVASIGQDEVERLMAEALAAVRDDLAAPCSIEMNKPRGAAASTLRTAEFLVAEGDFKRFHNWLARHNAEERAQIQKHLEAR
jgi:hypothetical protein